MTTYSIKPNDTIEIDFHGVMPEQNIRKKMKTVKFLWDPVNKVWFSHKNDKTLALAKRLCRGPANDYALKVKIRDIVEADETQLEAWKNELKDHVNELIGEDNSAYSEDTVSNSQEFAWMDCFKFIAKHLSALSPEKQEFELVFEYSLPGTVHERPDVFLLTAGKAVSLEFKRKNAPQVDENKDDVAQAIRYKECIENHHKVTRERALDVKSYLVCTHDRAVKGSLRGIEILTKDNFFDVIDAELEGESECSFIIDWLASSKTEMPDMLKAMDIMYHDGKIPYISDVNKKCLNKVLSYIDDAKTNHKKLLILINGVPGAGKTAVAQSIVFEENKGAANAVYLSGNRPLVEVIQYQIDQVGANEHMSENAIQGMKDFKSGYFSNAKGKNTKVPEQSVLVFDEAQRAWDKAKLKRGFSEPEGLFDVCERIYAARNYAVLVGLYGHGQVINDGEEAGLSLWEEALEKHTDWFVIASDEVASQIADLGERKITDNDLLLPVSLRADFIDCSKWVEQAISRTGADFSEAQRELAELQKTSMRICMTRDMSKIRERIAEIDADHPEWSYGIFISNFAEQNVIQKALPGWDIGYKGANTVLKGGYGQWFTEECKLLTKACSVFGSQGLELDCPIILFGGGYVRKGGKWLPRGSSYNYDKAQEGKYRDIDTIVENNFRVLLTKARKEMLLLIPDDPVLDETYQYFADMGMDVL